MTTRRQQLIACLVFLLAIVPVALFGQTAPATSVVNYPGAGVIQAGDVWESFLPAGFGPNSSETGTYQTLGIRTFTRLGNFERGWTTPGTHWPNAYPITPYWYKNIGVWVYDPDTTFNPAKINGVANPSYFANAQGAGNYSNYAQLTYKSKLNGANDPTRKYSIEPYWIGGNAGPRQHVVYEAAWPTNLGIDVVMRVHGFQGPNWNNLNDYVIIEIQMKNTGYLDMNMDSVAEKSNNEIKAAAAMISAQTYMSISSYLGGGRNANDIVPAIIARQAGFVMDEDENGSPWAFSAIRASATSKNPAAGKNDLGFNAGVSKNYTDVWTGFVMLDVKNGALPADRSMSTASLPSKQTVFGTHPIGVGLERGWYMAGGSTMLGYTTGYPKDMFTVCTGEWFADGGRSLATDVKNLSLAPNANFFASGTTGDILSFVPKPAGSRSKPDGDLKSTNNFDQSSFEDGMADATTPYPNGFGKFTKGVSHTEDFNGDMFSGVGPFTIPKDSTITIVMATVAGYRLEGIQKAVRAARWAYEQNYALPVTPPLPDVKVSNTLTKSVNVEWDARAESDAGFAGYKIWKASQYKKKEFLREGMRVADRYQENMTPAEETPEAFKKPVNPRFDAFAITASTSLKGTYQPDTWGTWDLLKVIPKADLATITPSTTTGMKYKYEDKNVILGFTYFYYVSAYKEGTFTGPGGETTSRIETHSTNRNGASGLWVGTYPFAPNNINFPKDATGLKNIGAAQVVVSAMAPKGDVSRVGVRPNPYKRTALQDNRINPYDHKLVFYNLPPVAKITIIDVSGQVIDVINFNAGKASNPGGPGYGSVYWDMFSKDGIEVASGLYVYIVESDAGSNVGYFSILR